jgi:hypothetical protein
LILHVIISVIVLYLIAVAVPSMAHTSKAGALFALIVVPITMILAAVLGPNRRYLVYLFAVAITAIFFLFIVPILPPDLTRAR